VAYLARDRVMARYPVAALTAGLAGEPGDLNEAGNQLTVIIRAEYRRAAAAQYVPHPAGSRPLAVCSAPISHICGCSAAQAGVRHDVVGLLFVAKRGNRYRMMADTGLLQDAKGATVPRSICVYGEEIMDIIKSATVALVVSALLLAGCGNRTGEPPKAAAAPAESKPADNGVAALSATEILKHAQKALAEAKSYHLSGEVHQDGEYYRIDVEVAGKNMLGSVSKNGMTREILVVDGQHLVRMDQEVLAWAFPMIAKDLTANLEKSWVEPDEKSFTDMAEGFDVAELLEPAGELTKGEIGMSNQRPVISVLDAGGDFQELQVATTGEPLPQKMRMVDAGRALFTEYGRAFPDIKAPAAKDIIDLSG
jgi:hypothetical protein